MRLAMIQRVPLAAHELVDLIEADRAALRRVELVKEFSQHDVGPRVAEDAVHGVDKLCAAQHPRTARTSAVSPPTARGWGGRPVSTPMSTPGTSGGGEVPLQ